MGTSLTGDEASCPCGSPWWVLAKDPRSADVTPSVTLSRDGKITGWCGRPVCAECGEPWAPARDRLSVVPDPVDPDPNPG